MEWLDVLKVFVGFVLGYGLTYLHERKRTSRIIGGTARPQHTTNKSISRIDQRTERRLPK